MVLAMLVAAYWLWTPGRVYTDGRRDRRCNGIWLQHGWLGDDAWFIRNRRQARLASFRHPDEIRRLAALLRRHGITDVFPHLCPAARDGSLPGVNAPQTRRFLSEFQDFRVMPWVGGVSGVHVFLDDDHWRRKFAQAIRKLLDTYPPLAGIQVNIEPCPAGNQGFLRLLEEIRRVLPPGKILSVAAYPPPTRLHPFKQIHWDRNYYREVAQRVDHLAVMMYDTSLPLSKAYIWLMAAWTRDVLAWCPDRQVLLGLPAYDDPDVGYHDPRVENLRQALQGIHDGLTHLGRVPENYRGVALYCEWEMDEGEWQTMAKYFEKPR